MRAYNTYSSVMASGKSPGVETAFMSNLCWSVTSYKVSFIVFYVRRWEWRRRRLLLSLALYLSEKWRFFCVQNNNNNNCICGFHLHPCIILHICIYYIYTLCRAISLALPCRFSSGTDDHGSPQSSVLRYNNNNIIVRRPWIRIAILYDIE